MARVITSTISQNIYAEIITRFSDGSFSSNIIKQEDEIENLRYIKDKRLLTAAGRVSEITCNISKVTSVNPNKPVDNFSKDVSLRTIVVDSSEIHHSILTSVPAREIVEDEGLTDVVKVDHIAHPEISFSIEYKDGTTDIQYIEVGDVFENVKVLAGKGKPDITGTFKVVALSYKKISDYVIDVDGVWFRPIEGGKAFVALFENIIELDEVAHVDATNPSSLSNVASALNDSDEVFCSLGVDVTIPKREDGKITTLMINSGKTLNVDLAGHQLNTQAYAFYVNGGTLNINDTSGNGTIKCTIPNNAYPAIFINSGGVCNMEGGIIDTTTIDSQSETDYNWIYGIVCSGDGVFNMSGGSITTGGAACLSITNGTASGEGAKFNISGNAVLTGGETGIYLADNKSIDISENAKVNNGILLRMGDLTVRDKAQVISQPASAKVSPLGSLVTFSGCDSHDAAILALTGIYGSSLGNDLNIIIKDSAKVKGARTNAIDIATINTKYDQKVTVDIESEKNLAYKKSGWNVYNHNQLADMVAEQGKVLAPETNVTDLTITVNGKVVNQ